MTARALHSRIAVVALLAAWQSAPAKSEVDTLLDGWQAKVATLTSFTCKFRQEKKVSFMRRPLVSTGTLAYRDRHLLWTTETPSKSFLALGEKEVRIYTPEFATLEVYPLSGAATGGAPKSGAAGPSFAASFPGFTGDLRQLREPYAAELVARGDDATRRTIRFTPRKDELKKEVVAVEITLTKELELAAWRIERTNGDTLALTISDFVANAKVADADLAFDVAPGTKVVKPFGEAKKDDEKKSDAPPPKKDGGGR
jgi:outer membrane lipoprotein-sorting protein